MSYGIYCKGGKALPCELLADAALLSLNYGHFGKISLENFDFSRVKFYVLVVVSCLGECS